MAASVFFFSIWVFLYDYSRFTGQQGKGQGISLTPLYHIHPLHRHLDISRAITAKSSSLHIEVDASIADAVVDASIVDVWQGLKLFLL